MSTVLSRAITDSLIAATHASKIGASFSTASLGAMKAPPLPIAVLSIIQSVLGLVVAGAMTYWLTTEGFVGIDEVPAWVMPLALLAGLACIASAIQLWRLRWSGPISFLSLWVLPFFGSLPFASPMEIIRDASFIEGRLAYLFVYGVIVFEFRRQFAPNKSSMDSSPTSS